MLKNTLERIEKQGKTPYIIPINGTGGSGKTVILKQCAVALSRQDKSVLFPRLGHSESIKFEDIEKLNEIALEKNDFFYICLDDFHKFSKEIQRKIIDTAEYWSNLILLIAYRDPIPGVVHGKIKSYRSINLDSQKDISLFIDRLKEISQKSRAVAQLLKEKQPLIELTSSDKPLRLFVFLYLFFDQKISEYDDPESAFRSDVQKEYEELQETNKELAEIVKSAVICANCGCCLPLETISKIYKDFTDPEYYAQMEHLFYVSSFLNMDVLLPVHDVIIDALILHSDMKYKVIQKQVILDILGHSTGKSYALLLNSMIYHREKMGFSMEELEPYTKKGLDQKIPGSYVDRWASLLAEEKGQDAGFKFAQEAIFQYGSRNINLLRKYLDWLPLEKKPPFVKQMVEEGVRDGIFLTKCLDVLPEEEREDFARGYLQNPIRSIQFLGRCLSVVQNKDPEILRKIARQNFKMAKSLYSIPFWIASLSLFAGCKEFEDILLEVEKFPAVERTISLSTHLVPLYSCIGCTNRRLCYWHRKNLEDHIDNHPNNRFSLARAYFYEKEDTKAQAEFRLLQSRQDAMALLSQLHLAWIDERKNNLDSKEIAKLEDYLESGKLKGNLLISANQLLARAYAKKGEFEKADGIINQLQYNYKTEALHYYTLGVVEELKRNTSDALTYYHKFLAIPNGKFYLNGIHILPLLKKVLKELKISYPYKLELKSKE